MARELLREYEVQLDELPESESGIGAFGVVLKSKLNGAPCAVKRLHEILLGSGNYEPVDFLSRHTLIEKFIDEIKFLKNQRHPNIVQFLGVCTLDPANPMESVALVMEHMEASIKDLISADSDCILSLGAKISILKDTACGVSHLHSQDIIHRDLNPGNVLLTSSLQAKVADLGVARVFPRSMSSPTMSMAPGATEFMPPESRQLNPEYGLPLDCFSFGHLALLLLIEDYPQVTDYGVDEATFNQALRENRVEILRRRSSFAKLEAGHVDQRILDLLKSCLNDNPIHRQSMNVIRKSLDVILSSMDYKPPSLVTILQQGRQIQELQEELKATSSLLTDRNAQIQRISSEVAEKQRNVNEYVNRCQTQDFMLRAKDDLIQQLNTEVSDKRNRCSTLKSELNVKDNRIQALTIEISEKLKLIQDYYDRCRSLESEVKSLKRPIEQSSDKDKAPHVPNTQRWSYHSNLPSTSCNGDSQPTKQTDKLSPVVPTPPTSVPPTSSTGTPNTTPSTVSPTGGPTISPVVPVIEPATVSTPTTLPPGTVSSTPTNTVSPTTVSPTNPTSVTPPEPQKAVLRKWPHSPPPPSVEDHSNTTSASPFGYATLPRRRATTVSGPTTAPKPIRTQKRTSVYENGSEHPTNHTSNDTPLQQTQQADFRTLLQGKRFKSRWETNAQETAQSRTAEEEIKRKRQQEMEALIQARREEQQDDDNDN